MLACLVRWCECGVDEPSSAPNAQGVVGGHHTPLPLRDTAPKVKEAHRRWWLDRFTVDEVRELAGAIWHD
jgi:hypothetical protein